MDFDGIKAGLVNFLKTAKDENDQAIFTDYNFNASGLSTIVDLLAYNTHIQALMANFVANEMFLDTAAKRSSVVSHAKSLGYTPRSTTAAKIPMTVTMNDPTIQGGLRPATYMIPKGIVAMSASGNVSLMFTTTQAYVMNWDSVQSKFIAYDVLFYEGVFAINTITYDRASPYIQIPNKKCDTGTLRVRVKNNSGVSFIEYQKVSNFLSVADTTTCFFIQESAAGGFEIYFGDGYFGYKPPTGATVELQYIVTNGAIGNDVSNLSLSSNLGAPAILNNQLNVDGDIIVATGGANIETIDSIKHKTLNHYGMQNRAVIPADYEALILEANMPNVKAVRVWGGEDDYPPQFNTVVICVEPKYGDYITQTDQNLIVNTLYPKSVGNMGFAFRNPEYIDLIINNTISYNPNTISISTYELESLAYNTIITYADSVSNFNSVFRSSNLISLLDAADPSVVSNNLQIRLAKFYRVFTNASNNITFSFNNTLSRDYYGATLVSTQFQIASFKGNVRFEDDRLGNIIIRALDESNIIVNNAAGYVDYVAGAVTIYPITFSSLSSYQMKFTAIPQNTDIGTTRNYIVRVPTSHDVVTVTSKAA